MPATRTIVGLDFGTYSIKAVWLEKGPEGVSIARTEELQIPPETQDPVRFIQPWLEKHALRKTLSAVAIPGTQTVFQPVVLPADDPRTEAEAAAAEVASFTEMAGEAMRYGATTVAAPDGSRVLQLALVRPGVVESGLRGAEAFDLRLCDLVPSPVAAFNGAVGGVADTGHPVLFASIGHQTTDLAIGSAGGLLFARSFAIGGKAFSDAIARARNVSDLQAERLKKAEGGLDAASPLADILRPVATMWAAQLRSALSVYRGQFPDPKAQPTRLLLVGGGARLAGLADFASDTLALPLAAVAADGPGAAPVDGRFTTAYGLALSGAEAGRCPITLFPEALRNEIVFREKKPYWIATGVFAALILGTFIAIAVRGIARERATVDAETLRIRKLEAIDTNIRRMRAEIASLRATAVPVRRMLEAGPQARELVKLLAESIHPNDWITMVSDEALYIAAEMPELPEEDKRPGGRPKAAPKTRPALRMAAKASGANGGPAAPAAPKSPAPKKKGKAEKPAPDEIPLPPPAPPTFSVFIVEGYTPQTDLSTVKQLIEKLIQSPYVRRADVLVDDLVLPAMPLGDERPPESVIGKLARFVLRVEVSPIEEGGRP